MNKEYISIIKFLNFLFVVFLTMCASPIFFYGLPYDDILALVGIIGYGITLKEIGGYWDKLVRVK